jgi:hypothetical protein
MHVTSIDAGRVDTVARECAFPWMSVGNVSELAEYAPVDPMA